VIITVVTAIYRNTSNIELERALSTTRTELQESQKKLDNFARQGIFQPLSTEMKEKVIAALKEVRRKYYDNTPSIQMTINGNFMSMNIRSIIGELMEIFVSSGFKILLLRADAGYGFVG
jgi:hypothetical protein